MASSKELIEYRVKDVSRFIVTRYQTGPQGGSITEKGEYSNATVAHEVAYALCRAEHEQLGWPLSDERIRYPEYPGSASCAKELPAPGPIGTGGIKASGSLA